ncbi:hypothetical protein PPACK8108_LOCUS15998 [Phakopsora pachyrhizi]|uniref:Uncharacterized protein n=1 Tax=Phakopsora pachyrhizi TaxID=170000 RepID=A0AAV0BCD9_PHAPC|nr:hypothetical protein PPACK8108_LOCUS15998 [Phakopsora pachyrhizi]
MRGDVIDNGEDDEDGREQGLEVVEWSANQASGLICEWMMMDDGIMMVEEVVGVDEEVVVEDDRDVYDWIGGPKCHGSSRCQTGKS